MRLEGRKILIACGLANATITLYHIGFFIVIGPARGLFGGSEVDARLPAVTLAVAAIFAAFTAYTLSGAGIIHRLPLLKLSLMIPAAVYTLYGIALLLQRAHIIPSPAELDWKNFVFGGIIGIGALILGVGHFVGVRTAPSLKVQRSMNQQNKFQIHS